MAYVPSYGRPGALTIGAEPDADQPLPDRSFGETSLDTALDVGRGFAGLGRAGTTLARDVAGEGGFWEGADKAARAAEDWMGKQQSPTGQAIATGQASLLEHPAGYALHTVASFAPWVLVGEGLAALGAATGPLAPAVVPAISAGFWTAMGDAQYRGAVRDIADGPLDKISGTQQWQELLKNNNGDEKGARNDLYKNMLDARSEALSAGAGAALALPLTRPLRGALTTRTGGAALGAAEMGAGLGAQTGAVSYGQQVAEQRAGIRQQIDAAPIIDEALKAGLTGALAGGVMGGIARPRGAIDTGAPRREEAPPAATPPSAPVAPDLAAALGEYGWDIPQIPGAPPGVGGGRPSEPPPPPPSAPPPAPPRRGPPEGPPAPTTFPMEEFRPRGFEEPDYGHEPTPVAAPVAPAGTVEERGAALLAEAQEMVGRGEKPADNPDFVKRYTAWDAERQGAEAAPTVEATPAAAPAAATEIPEAAPASEPKVTRRGKRTLTGTHDLTPSEQASVEALARGEGKPATLGAKGEAVKQKAKTRAAKEPVKEEPAQALAVDETEVRRREQRLDDLVAERREAQDMGDHTRLGEIDREIAEVEAQQTAAPAPAPAATAVAGARNVTKAVSRGKQIVQRVRAKKETPAAPARREGTLTLKGDEPAVARPQDAEPAPPRPSKIYPNAKFVGRHDNGTAIWELPNGKRQFINEKGDLVREGRAKKGTPRAADFEITRKPRVFDVPPTADVVAKKRAFRTLLNERMAALEKREERAQDAEVYSRMDPEDIVEGKTVPSEQEIEQLSKDGKTLLRRLKDRYWRNWAAKGPIEDYGKNSKTDVNALLETAATPTAPMADRVRALRSLIQEARGLEGDIQRMYNWMAEDIRKGSAEHGVSGHEPLASFQVGGKARDRSGMWHNFAMRLGAAKKSAQDLLQSVGIPHESDTALPDFMERFPPVKELTERANDLFKLLQSAKDGERGIMAVEGERRGVNLEVTAQRKGTSTDVATLSDTERQAEIERLTAEGQAEDTGEGAPAAHETLERDETTAQPKQQQQQEEPEASYEMEDEPDEKLYAPKRYRRDPTLSDDDLDRLRKMDPKAAKAIDDLQHSWKLGYEGHREALEAVVGAADHLGDDLPLANALVKYLKQVVENQKKGILFGQDVISGPNRVLEGLAGEGHVKGEMTGGDVIDRMLTRTDLNTKGSMLRALFLGKFRGLLDQVPVVFLDEPGIRKSAPLNLHPPAGYYDPTSGHVVLNHSWLKGRDDADSTMLVAHELVHATAHRAINEDRQLRLGLWQLLEHVRQGAKKDGIEWEQYGLTDIHELMSEAWSNPEFQDYLAKKSLTREQWSNLGFNEEPPSARNLWGGLVNFVSRALGYGKFSRTALDAVMRLTERIPTDRPNWERGLAPDTLKFTRRGNDAIPDDTSSNRTLLNRLNDTHSGMSTGRMAFAVHSFTDLTRRGERAFQDVTRPVYEAVAKIGETRDRLLTQHRVNEVMRQLDTYTRHFDRDRRFARFLIDETTHGAYADQALDHESNRHIGSSLQHEQTRLQHPEMMQRYRDVVTNNPAAVALRQRLHGVAREMGVNEINRRTISNYFEAQGDTPELAAAKTQRILTPRRRLDEAQQALLDAIPRNTLADSLREAYATPEFRRMVGPYVPLMRHGDHVVRGTYDLSSLGRSHGGIPLANGRSMVFSGDTAARAYIADVTRQLGLSQRRSQRVVWDKTANEVADRLTVDQLGDLQTQGDPAAAGYELRHMVDFNNEHFETFDRNGDARRRVQQLRDWATAQNHPLQVRDVERLRDTPGGASALHMSDQMAAVVRRVQGSPQFQMLPAHRQAEILQSFQEAAARANVRSGAAGRFLPRLLTEGASDNLVRNYAEFFQSTANYMARAEHSIELDNTLRGMNEYTQTYRHGGGHEVRDAVSQEIIRRVSERPQVWSGSVFGHAINRILGLSYLDKLASPGFLAINMSEPIMLGIPMMGGRHGGMRTAQALMRAYRDVGAMGILGRGGRDFLRATRGQREFEDWIDFLKGRLKDPEEQALIQHLADRGWFNANSTQQLEQIYTPNANMFGRAADYADNTFRQLNTAVENLNRAVTALAAYRLERTNRRGGPKDHESALVYAGEKLGEIAGNYSAYNAAPIFNSPLGKLALQFKKYPQRILGNYFRLIGESFQGNPEAMKGLLLATGMQTLVAGMLGLPTEPLKAAFTALNIAGVGPSWDEAEHGLRAFMTSHFGPEFGEILSRGLPRYAGVDLGRLGHDSLLTFGTPPSSKPTDLKAGAFNLIAGAPGGLAADALQGIQDIVAANRHFATGANEQGRQKLLEAGRGLLPLKTGADIVDAWLRSSQSRFTTQPGGAPRQPLYSTGDQLIRGLGFTPGWEAEMGEARRFAASQRQINQQDRSGIMREWVHATPAERNAVWSSIEEWNRGQPSDQRVTRGDLIKAQTREARQARAPVSDLGVRFGRRDQSIKRELDTYNLPVH